MKQCPQCLRPFVDTQETCPLDEARLEFEAVQPPENVGRELGNYRLIGLLGEGGMGNVYIAAHTRLNRHVAIKLLRPELRDRSEAIARFFDEAQTVNRAKHPNIVESIDLVDDVIDGAYCVLELLRGVDLATRLASGRLSLGSAVQIATQIADALGVVHKLGVVHRDLKPHNLILIERDGRDDFVKLIDFGVAQMTDGTVSGRPFGTPAYMAPEQAAGERVDGRADVYALGVVLFEMVTGRHPFPAANDHEYLLRHADDPPPRPSKVVPAARIPRQLESIILRCLEKNPAGRYPDAAALATALRLVDLRPSRSKLWVAAALLIAGGTAAALILPDMLAGKTAAPVPVPQVAAAPPPPPPPPVEPVREPAISELSFESTPPGANVFREGETVALGTTPFTIKLRSSDRPARVRFELAGHEPMVVEPTRDAVTATLVQIKQDPPVIVTTPKPQRPKPTKPAGLQREGVMDPFAQQGKQ
jgi:eukaryotic-like serine/threonine-protein kinase